MDKTIWFVFWYRFHVWCLFHSFVVFLFFISKTDKKNQTVEADLDKDISKLQLEFDRLDKTREQLTNKILLTQLTEQKQ